MATWCRTRWAAAALAYAMLCVFGAAVVRGFSGFGFSLLAITAISLVVPPVVVVPSIFLMEVAASLLFCRPCGARCIGARSAPARRLPGGNPTGRLAPGDGAGPTHADGVGTGRAGCGGPARPWLRASCHARAAATLATGAASGLLNGAFGIGGPPVILFFFASPAGVAAGRASVIAYFLGTDLIGLGFMLRQGLIGAPQLWLALAFVPALVAGVWLGARGFRGTDQATFHRWTLRLLMLLAALTTAQGIRATRRLSSAYAAPPPNAARIRSTASTGVSRPAATACTVSGSSARTAA